MRSERGAILIEAILGLTIATIIITALVTVLVSSLSNATFSRNQTIATGYAQEYMELTRSLKDDNFDTLQALADSGSPSDQFCFRPSGLSEGCVDSIDGEDRDIIDFDRYLRIYVETTPVASRKCPNSIYVESVVAWEDSKCSGGAKCHDVTLKSCFSNLDYVPL